MKIIACILIFGSGIVLGSVWQALFPENNHSNDWWYATAGQGVIFLSIGLLYIFKKPEKSQNNVSSISASEGTAQR
jgi:surface polysaccharide O-acyltransferase-like enzyme